MTGSDQGSIATGHPSHAGLLASHFQSLNLADPSVEAASKQDLIPVSITQNSSQNCSLVCALPADVLLEIFLRNRDTYVPVEFTANNVDWQGIECRLSYIAVSHVCRSWRQLAIESPLLWTYVSLFYPHKWIEAILTRSGNTLLTVYSGDPDPTMTDPERRYRQTQRSYTALPMILKHFYRIRSFRITVAGARIHSLLQPYLSGAAPELQCFELLTVMGSRTANFADLFTWTRDSPKVLRLEFSSAPKLSAVSILGGQCIVWEKTMIPPSVSRLALHFLLDKPGWSPSLRELFRILRRSGNDLKELWVSCPASPPAQGIANHHTPPSHDPELTPRSLNLEQLHFCILTGKSSNLAAFLKVLTVRALPWLTVICTDGIGMGFNTSDLDSPGGPMDNLASEFASRLSLECYTDVVLGMSGKGGGMETHHRGICCRTLTLHLISKPSWGTDYVPISQHTAPDALNGSTDKIGMAHVSVADHFSRFGSPVYRTLHVFWRHLALHKVLRLTVRHPGDFFGVHREQWTEVLAPLTSLQVLVVDFGASKPGYSGSVDEFLRAVSSMALPSLRKIILASTSNISYKRSGPEPSVALSEEAFNAFLQGLQRRVEEGRRLHSIVLAGTKVSFGMLAQEQGQSVLARLCDKLQMVEQET